MIIAFFHGVCPGLWRGQVGEGEQDFFAIKRETEKNSVEIFFFFKPPHLVPCGAKPCQATQLLAWCLLHNNAHNLITRLQPPLWEAPVWNIRLTGKDAAEPGFPEAQGNWSFPMERVFPACLQLDGSTAPLCLLARHRSLPRSTMSFHLCQEQRSVCI